MSTTQLLPNTQRTTEQLAYPHGNEARLDLLTSYVAPTAGLETTIAAIWAQFLDVERVGATDDFFDLGGSSLLAVQMLAALENTLGQKAPALALVQGQTVRGMAAWLNRNTQVAKRNLLVAIQATGQYPPLYLIPPTKGSALSFLGLSRELGPDYPLFAFDDAAVEGNEWTIQELATRYVQELQNAQPKTPYVIGGMCSGATLALEMVQQLAKMGQEVPFLLVLDGAAPGWGVPKDMRGKYTHYVKRLNDHIQQNTVGYMLRTQLRLRWNRWISRFTKRKDQRTYASYQPQVTNTKIVLYESEERYRIRHHERWQKWANVTLDCLLVPGTTHRSVLKDQASIIYIANDLRARLAKLQSV